MLCYISKILKNESNSQLDYVLDKLDDCCVISQRYSKMKAIHNIWDVVPSDDYVVLYLKDTQKWKQFTTVSTTSISKWMLCYISKILKNESNSQRSGTSSKKQISCVISQRYSKMKAIHNF